MSYALRLAKTPTWRDGTAILISSNQVLLYIRRAAKLIRRIILGQGHEIARLLSYGDGEDLIAMRLERCILSSRVLLDQQLALISETPDTNASTTTQLALDIALLKQLDAASEVIRLRTFLLSVGPDLTLASVCHQKFDLLQRALITLRSFYIHKARLIDRTLVACDPAIHSVALEELWTLLSPNESLAESTSAKPWQTLGFQGATPSTDFRGVGMLG